MSEFVSNLEGLHAVAEVRRRRRRFREAGICCANYDGPCPTCEAEAEARKAARDA